ncbi:MAG: response regulator [Deltaproteobacteria bacterium]|nr:response regulator [Deltaproteobacteria bacterium]
MRVLYVEDDPDTQNMYRRRLEARGVELHTASNGSEAIELLRRQHFDALILDVMMPGIDGFQVGEVARREGKNKKLAIIILTAHPAALKDSRADRLEPLGKFIKPVKMDKLMALLEKAGESAKS